MYIEENKNEIVIAASIYTRKEKPFFLNTADCEKQQENSKIFCKHC